MRTEQFFRFAHISDLHISAAHKGQTIRQARRVLEHVLRHPIDHLVVTGDVTANGTPKELELARSVFESYGLMDTNRLTVIPGNHDVFGGVHSAEDVLSFPARCKAVDYDAAVRRFCEAFSEVFACTLSLDAANRFPFVKVLGTVAMFGINSVARYGRTKNPFGSNGMVDREQVKLLRSFLTAGAYRGLTKVVLIHHHFQRKPPTPTGAVEYMWRTIERRTMRLHRKRKLLRLFAENDVRLVLHGHIHENTEYERRGIRCMNSGATVMGQGTGLNYRLLYVQDGSITTSVNYLPRDADFAISVRPKGHSGQLLPLPALYRRIDVGVTAS